jgi:hypothetical protein
MSYAINQFIDRCLESHSIDCSPDYVGGDPDVDVLLGALAHVRSGLKRLGKERVKQDLPTETEDFDGTTEMNEEYYDPEKDPELSWMYEDSADLPPEPPVANSESQAESEKERLLREYEEFYGRPRQRR